MMYGSIATTGTNTSTTRLITQSPIDFRTSNQRDTLAEPGGGCGTTLDAGAGGWPCSSGSGVSCWEDSSVITRRSLGGCYAPVKLRRQTAGYSMSSIGKPT